METGYYWCKTEDTDWQIYFYNKQRDAFFDDYNEDYFNRDYFGETFRVHPQRILNPDEVQK